MKNEEDELKNEEQENSTILWIGVVGSGVGGLGVGGWGVGVWVDREWVGRWMGEVDRGGCGVYGGGCISGGWGKVNGGWMLGSNHINIRNDYIKSITCSRAYIYLS